MQDNELRTTQSTTQSDTQSALFEQLAAIEHQRWADWQAYFFSKCEQREDGALIVPAGYVNALLLQIATPYADLTEQEKESDREEVRRYWHLLEESE